MSFSSVTSTLKLKTNSQLTQSPFTGTDCLFSSTLLGSKTTQPLETYCSSEQPNLSEAIRTTLQQWKWVTSIDFKDAYFHLSIQEQSRTYKISCPGSGIPVQSTVFRSVHYTHGPNCSSKKLKLMAVHKGIITSQYLDD